MQLPIDTPLVVHQHGSGHMTVTRAVTSATMGPYNGSKMTGFQGHIGLYLRPRVKILPEVQTDGLSPGHIDIVTHSH